MHARNGGTYSTFLCPHCGVELNPGAGPIIKMRGRLDAPSFSVTTDLFLSSALGVYGRLSSDDVNLKEGAKIEFSCPGCEHSFSRSEEDDLAKIDMRDAEGRVFEVRFNKHYGKRSTFVVDPEERRVEKAFGRDADAYREALEKRLNFFGA